MLLVFLFADAAELEKFEALYTRYKGLLLYKARGILGDALAEDAVSEAFVRVYRNLHKIGEVGSPQTASFLVTIVRNAALTILAHEKKGAGEVMDDAIPDRFDLESSVVSALTERDMFRAVDRLAEDLRAVFVLRYAHGLSGREIARTLDISESNVNVRLHRAKRKLSEFLVREGYAHDAV